MCRNAAPETSLAESVSHLLLNSEQVLVKYGSEQRAGSRLSAAPPRGDWSGSPDSEVAHLLSEHTALPCLVGVCLSTDVTAWHTQVPLSACCLPSAMSVTTPFLKSWHSSRWFSHACQSCSPAPSSSPPCSFPRCFVCPHSLDISV